MPETITTSTPILTPTSTSDPAQFYGESVVSYKGEGGTTGTPISGTYYPFPIKPISTPIQTSNQATQEATQLQTDITQAQTAPVVVESADLTRLKELGTKGEDLLTQRRKQLEESRTAAQQRIEYEFGRKEEELRKAQEKGAGRAAVTTARLSGFLGPSGSGEAFLQNLETVHRQEQRDMFLQKQMALTQAQNAFNEGDFKLAQLQLESARQTESDIFNREKDFREEQRKTRQEIRTQEEFDFNMEKSISNITGIFRGDITFEAQNELFRQAIQRANLTGEFEGADTLAKQQMIFNQGISEWEMDLDSQIKQIAIEKGGMEIQQMYDELFGTQVTTPDDLSPLAKAVYNGTVDLKDITPTERAAIIPELDTIGWKQTLDAESRATVDSIIVGMDDVLEKWKAVPTIYKGVVAGRMADWTKLQDLVPEIAEFKAAANIVGMQLTRLFEKGRISDQDRLFYLGLMPNMRQTENTATASAQELQARLRNKLTGGGTIIQKPTSTEDFISQADSETLNTLEDIKNKAREQGYSDAEIESKLKDYLQENDYISYGGGGGMALAIGSQWLTNFGQITGYGSSYWNEGLDVSAKKGDPIPAPFTAKVNGVLSASKSGGFGNQIRLQDKKGNELWISHLDKINKFKIGSTISAGTFIGNAGNTGNVLTKHGDKWEPPTRKELAQGAGTHLDLTIKKLDGTYMTAKEVEQYLRR